VWSFFFLKEQRCEVILRCDVLSDGFSADFFFKQETAKEVTNS
jgi:hypothetical protein